MKKNNVLNKLLNKQLSPAERFHNSTKNKKRVSLRNPKYWPKSWIEIYFKAYPRLDEIVLPEPKLPTKISLKQALIERKSTRNFSKEPVSKEALSAILFYSAGMKNGKQPSRGRFYPSPGGRYPLEVYLISLNTDIPKGVYHYYVKNHSLEELVVFNKFDFNKYLIKQRWIPQSSLLVVITGVFRRNTVKYGDRGYRHVLVEAGHMAQNFYLNSWALGLGCCGIGGYMENKLEELLDIDGIEESVVYVLALGNLTNSSKKG